MSDLPTRADRLGRARAAARRTLRWTAILAALLLLLPVLALVLVGTLEISISAGPWRDRIGAAASEALGRRVTLEGPLELVPSLRPVLKVGGIRIENPPGFTTPEFAFLGEARLRVDLRALLRKRLHIMEVVAVVSGDGFRLNAGVLIGQRYGGPGNCGPRGVGDRSQHLRGFKLAEQQRRGRKPDDEPNKFSNL